MPEDERRAMALWPSLEPLFIRGDLAAARANAFEQLGWTQDHHDWGFRDWGMSAHAGALFVLGRIELYGGLLGRARELLDRGIQIARGLGDGEMEVACSGALCRVAQMAGEAELARAAAHRSIELSERLGTVSRVGAHTALGTQLFLDGDADQAAETWEDALSLCGPSTYNLEPYLRCCLARARLAAGNPGPARAVAEEALARCLDIDARLEAIEAALAVSATLRADAGAGGAARIDEVLATAERLIAETGARNLTAFVLVERAALSELGGDEQQRLIYLRDALAQFEQMGASGQVARLEQEIDR